ITRHPLPVDVPLVALTVRADAMLVEEDSPLCEEVTERVLVRIRRLDMDDAVGVVRVELRQVGELRRAAEADERGHRQRLSVEENVEMLVNVVRKLLRWGAA